MKQKKYYFSIFIKKDKKNLDHDVRGMGKPMCFYIFEYDETYFINVLGF